MLIYRITNTVNGKVYIGKWHGISPEPRWKQHIYAAKKGSGCTIHKAIRKYGEFNFSVEVIATASSPKQLSVMETEFIKLNKSHQPEFGYNMTLGGDGAPHGELNWMFGRPKTPSLLEACSRGGRVGGLKNKGKTRSLEVRKRLSTYRKTHPMISACEEYKVDIIKLLEETPNISTREIWEILVTRGFSKKWLAVARYVKKLRGISNADKHKQNWAAYLQNPNKCLNCSDPIIPKRRCDLTSTINRLYCSRVCANKVNNTGRAAQAA